MSGCSETCRTAVECVACKRRKAPRARSVAVAMAGTHCDTDCIGYFEAPWPGHLWPGESFDDKCADCGEQADDKCPGCGKYVCSSCAEKEGAFCCDGEGGGVAP